MVNTVKSDQSRSTSRAQLSQINDEPVEIPESRATMNNFVSIIYLNYIFSLNLEPLKRLISVSKNYSNQNISIKILINYFFRTFRIF